MPVYRQQLDDADSEASRHLSRMTTVIQKLQADEPAYLRKNFQVDSDYFDIQPLRPAQAKKKTRP